MQLQELCVHEATPPPRSIKTRLNKSEHGQDWRAVSLRLRPPEHGQKRILGVGLAVIEDTSAIAGRHSNWPRLA